MLNIIYYFFRPDLTVGTICLARRNLPAVEAVLALLGGRPFPTGVFGPTGFTSETQDHQHT